MLARVQTKPSVFRTNVGGGVNNGRDIESRAKPAAICTDPRLGTPVRR